MGSKDKPKRMSKQEWEKFPVWAKCDLYLGDIPYAKRMEFIRINRSDIAEKLEAKRAERMLKRQGNG